jgi:undecaprenyl-diphosphatase
MSDLLKAVILAVIEGLTEFLPVSSTGHMLLAMPMLDVEPSLPPWNVFLYFIQIGAILAVLVYFARPLAREIFSRPTDGLHNHLLFKLFVATLPAVILGLSLNKWVEAHLEKPVFVAAALILGAGAMEWIERRYRRVSDMTVRDVTLRQAFLVGVAQCVSIIPGTSRSMATIMGGLMVGLSPGVAAEFSFYLAIPTLFGAGLYRLAAHRHALEAEHALPLAVGFIVAFIVAMIVVDAFLRYVRTYRLRPFAIYRVLLGLTVLAYYLWPNGAE